MALHFAIHYTTFCRNTSHDLHTSFHPSAPACIHTYIRTCIHSYKFACTVIGSERLTSKFFKIVYLLTAMSPAPSGSFSPSLLLHFSIRSYSLCRHLNNLALSLSVSLCLSFILFLSLSPSPSICISLTLNPRQQILFRWILYGLGALCYDTRCCASRLATR